MSTGTHLQVPREPRLATAIARAALLLLWPRQYGSRYLRCCVLRSRSSISSSAGWGSSASSARFSTSCSLRSPSALLAAHVGFAAVCGVTLLLYEALLRFFSR